jgi:RNA polymerase sigma-70 factor (ECF subfamily)
MAGKISTLPDDVLAQSTWEAGDNDCFAELFARYRKRVFCACRGFFPDSQGAEDATQETFLRAYRNIRSFQDGDFSRWLLRIAKNVCIDEWRRSHPETGIGGLELADRAAPNSLDSSFEQRQMVERLWQEIRSLPSEQRQCLELKVEGCSYTEWEPAEQRLDRWLESFLASEAAVYQAGRGARESHPRLWWKRLASPPMGWRMRWVLVPAATLAVVVCSFLAGRLSAPRPQQLTADATPYGTSSLGPIPAGTVAEGRTPQIASSAPARISPPAASRAAPLEPVTQSGAVLIGRNAEVSGIMTVRNGKRSVQILELLSTGAHYRLRSTSGEAGLCLLGAGEALEFDAGRVLETWMASVSMYEKLPGEPRPPE